MESSNSWLSFIGTHSDRVTEKDVCDIDQIIKKTVLDAGLMHVWIRSVTNCDYVIPVNNTTSGKCEEDKNASNICRKLNQLLLDKSVYNVPIVWVLLELEVRKVCNDRECNFITYSEVVELCKVKQLSKDEEFIKNGLRFHHLFGVLLYFEKVKGMKNLIITNLQWLFKNITNIVRHQYHNFDNVTVHKDFIHRGIFHKTLLDKIDLEKESFKKSEVNNQGFDLKISFLNLFKYLHIIAPIEEPGGISKFLMPSLLKTCNFETNQLIFLEEFGTNIISKRQIALIPLLIQFTKCTVHDGYGMFPRGVFCCLAVQLLDKHPSWRS